MAYLTPSHFETMQIDTKRIEYPDERYFALWLRSSDTEEARSSNDLSQFLHNIGIRDFVVGRTRGERSSSYQHPLTALLAFLLIVFTLEKISRKIEKRRGKERKGKLNANLSCTLIKPNEYNSNLKSKPLSYLSYCLRKHVPFDKLLYFVNNGLKKQKLKLCFVLKIYV